MGRGGRERAPPTCPISKKRAERTKPRKPLLRSVRGGGGERVRYRCHVRMREYFVPQADTSTEGSPSANLSIAGEFQIAVELEDLRLGERLQEVPSRRLRVGKRRASNQLSRTVEVVGRATQLDLRAQ